MLILELESISKSFGGLSAVRNLSFTLTAGKILALIGPNGSGKTTAFNLISGFLKPDTGTIRFNGRNIAGVRAYNVCQAGITRTFQSIRAFMNMTALENVMVGRLYGNEPARSMKEARIESEEILVLMGLDKKRLTRAGMLGLVDRKRLEIARALATRPRLLLLDEMMAGLNPRELEDAMRLIKGIRDSGVTLIVVEHVMKAVWGISDSVIVLNAGQKIAEGTPGEIMNNTQVIEAYLGEEQGA